MTFNFYIKRDSTLPTLKFPIDQEFLDKFGILNEDMNNAAVTFSMYNIDTDEYHIANVGGRIKYRNDALYSAIAPKYSLEYDFKLSDTSVTGNYYGEFKLDLLNSENPMKITIPNTGVMSITITDTITKTSLY